MDKEQQQLRDIVQQAHTWRVLLDEGLASDAEKTEFQQWLNADPRHSESFERARTVWRALGELDKPQFDSSLHRRSLTERRNNGPEWLNFMNLKPVYAGVSVLLLALLLMVMLPGKKPTEPKIAPIYTASYDTTQLQTRTVQLKDGTSITLGAASAVSVAISDAWRRVNLEKGQAYFAVSKDVNRPFTVSAEDMTVTVLGTEFDVKLQSSLTRIAVAEGEVKVSYPYMINQTPTTLKNHASLVAGQQIRSSKINGLQSVESIDVSSVGAWRDNRLVYAGSPLSELIEDANRYTNTQVVLQDDSGQLAQLQIRGAFNTQDIDGMLTTLAQIHPLELERTGPGRITIKPKN